MQCSREGCEAKATAMVYGSDMRLAGWCKDHHPYGVKQLTKHAREHDLLGEPASDAEVAVDLGFPDVSTMRR